MRNHFLAKPSPQFGIIIPVCDEEACIAAVLDEFFASIDSEKFVVVVGVNGSSDKTAEIARRYPVLVAETTERGYGFGCQAAIKLAARVLPPLRGYIFLAGDGASDPRDLRQLTAAFEQGYALVLGARTGRISNWRVMTLSHVLANFSLGLWCGLLTGKWFADLGPLRLIGRELYETLALRELTFGWTIEAQVRAARLGAAICEVDVGERPRLAGTQKVSGVNWHRTFAIGCRIAVAGWIARRRCGRNESTAPISTSLAAQSDRAPNIACLPGR